MWLKISPPQEEYNEKRQEKAKNKNIKGEAFVEQAPDHRQDKAIADLTEHSETSIKFKFKKFFFTKRHGEQRGSRNSLKTK